MKKIASITIIIFLSIFFLFANTTSKIAYENLSPEPQHMQECQLITYLLTNNHYEKKILDDSLSSEIFDRYLEILDNSKFYFLESDIQSFEKYRYLFDDFFNAGKVQHGYDIFAIYQQRYADWLDYMFESINEGFDFAIDEDINIDRENVRWAKSKDELQEFWRKQIKSEALNLKLTGKEPEAITEILLKRYERRQKNFEQFHSEDVFYMLMNSLSESYDPNTNYLSPKRSDDFMIDMSLSLEGIGAQLTTDNDYTKVVRIIPGGPADKSKKLFENDKITAVGQDIDGEIVDVIGWRIDDVVQLIRGPKSTTVRLEILRADALPGSAPDTISLVREKVKLEDQAAQSDTITIIHEGKKFHLGVIDIPKFYSDIDALNEGDQNYKSTTHDVKKYLKEFIKQDVDGVIIDLRRNGGGFLNEAIDLTGLFIDRGPVVQVRNMYGKVKVEWDTDLEQIYNGPLIVLVDRISASASEIFAAAIQDYNRGIVIGSQSFGKGTVQNATDLNRYVKNAPGRLGQLKLTIAKFYRINGGSTQQIGVIPDISFSSRLNLMDIGENSRKNALSWDKIQPARYSKYNNLSNTINSLNLKHNIRTGKNYKFKELVKNLTEFEEAKEIKIISLNEDKRRKEQQELEKRKLTDKKDTKEDNYKNERLNDDLLLAESAHILSDFIIITKKNN